MSDITQAVLLAAGASSRFFPLSASRHKCEITLMGTSLINRTVAKLLQIGITDIVIVHAEHHKLSIDQFDNATVTLVPLDKPKGMGHALLRARKHLQDSFFIVHPYHIECSSYLPAMAKAIHGKKGVLLLSNPTMGRPGGYAVFSDNIVHSIEEKASYQGEKDTLYVQGAYALSKEYIGYLASEKQHHYSFETALDRFVKENDVTAHCVEKQLHSLKYPWDLFALRDALLSKLSPTVHSSASIHRTAVVDETVHIEEGASIGAFAVLRGHCYIGKNTFVGDHSLVRDGAVLEEGAQVGAYAEVKNSIVMEGSYAQGYMADSVIGRNVKIAHGLITGNRRLDRESIHATVSTKRVDTGRKTFGVAVGDNAVFGISVCTMPGVLIGANATVGPGTVVFENVSPGAQYFKKQSIRVKKPQA